MAGLTLTACSSNPIAPSNGNQYSALNKEKYGADVKLEITGNEYLLYWIKDGSIIYAEQGQVEDDTLYPKQALVDDDGSLDINEDNKSYLLSSDSPLYSTNLENFRRPPNGQMYPYWKKIEVPYYTKGRPVEARIRFVGLNKDGTEDGNQYEKIEDVPVPEWQSESMDPLYMQQSFNYCWLFSDEKREDLVYELVQ